jgi:hypothetical protein
MKLNYLLLTALAFMMISCGEDDIEGCMDPQSSNFNMEATVDDGSCTYDRDKFISDYNGTITFSGNLAFLNTGEPVDFNIASGVDPDNKSEVIVSLTVSEIPLSVNAVVTDCTAELDQMLSQIPIDFMGIMLTADINVTGTVVIEGDALTGNMNVSVMLPAATLDDIGVIDATKS